MRWKRVLKIAGLIVLGLLVITALWLVIAKPWQPPIEVADPGPSGRRVAEAGLLANYYEGKGRGPRPAILMLGGSEGGLSARGSMVARHHAERGYSTLQLSYFRAPGQPTKLENIPLEYFDKALAWLRSQPMVDDSRMAVIGGSKGAEAALLIASRHPELKAVVAAMPSGVVWSGVDWNFGRVGSSWSELGRPLPYLPIGKFDWSRVGQHGLVTMYNDGLAALPRRPEAIIPIERASAPILLICGEEDRMWPSCPMARLIQARAKRHGRPEVVLLAYRDAGHAVHGMPRPRSDPNFANLGKNGGSAEGNNNARQDNWPRMLAFLDEAIGQSGE
jgi:dienelactone hydrolase